MTFARLRPLLKEIFPNNVINISECILTPTIFYNNYMSKYTHTRDKRSKEEILNNTKTKEKSRLVNWSWFRIWNELKQ